MYLAVVCGAGPAAPLPPPVAGIHRALDNLIGTRFN